MEEESEKHQNRQHRKITVYFLVGLSLIFACAILSVFSIIRTIQTRTLTPVSNRNGSNDLVGGNNVQLSGNENLDKNGGQTWLVLLYMDADDEILEEDIYRDLNEAERIGSSDRVSIVAQIDRYHGGFDGDGDWSTAKRFYVTQDKDMEHIKSQELSDLGEVNMADGNTLIDFVTWSVAHYPSDKVVLIMSDHGEGWPGGWFDADFPNFDGKENNKLTLDKLDNALGTIRLRTGLDKFELIGLDACLMSQLEVYTMLASHARYAVASQEVEPSLGWAYAAFLGALETNPDMSGAELGGAIVASYVNLDQVMIDDQARARFLEKGYSFSSDASAVDVVREISMDTTLTAVDLSLLPNLVMELNQVVGNISKTDHAAVSKARVYAQPFKSVFGDEFPPSYIDLGSFMKLLQAESNNPLIDQSVNKLLETMHQMIVAEKHGKRKSGSNGITIYFPNIQLYNSDGLPGARSYRTIANRFVDTSTWDEFLDELYADESQERVDGVIKIAPISLSSETIKGDEFVNIKTTITGKMISYIYLFVGYYNIADNAVLIADKDYIKAENVKNIGGISYPDWGETGTVQIDFNWQPTLYILSDGVKNEYALLAPEKYGSSDTNTTFTVDGMYKSSESGDSRFATMVFGLDGEMKQVIVFTGEGGTGAPHEIIPHQGDKFTIRERWFQFGDGQGKFVDRQGGVLTFEKVNFTWEAAPAYPGQYLIGFIAEDLEGNTQMEIRLINIIE